MQQTKTLTVTDVAQLCKVSINTVVNWINENLLRADPLDTTLAPQGPKIAMQDLLSFLQHQEMPIPDALSQYECPILIIDDDEAFARAIQRVCRLNGYGTRVATDGFTAGSLLLALKPRLITLDLQMPGINGFDVIEYIRKDLLLKELKILVVSAMPDSHINQALVLGADMAIGKPFTHKQLLAAIAQLMPAHVA